MVTITSGRRPRLLAALLLCATLGASAEAGGRQGRSHHAGRTVYVVLFRSTSCPECKPGAETAKQAVADMPGVELIVRDVDLSVDYQLFGFLARRAGLDPAQTVAAPSVFVDTDYLDMRYCGGWKVKRLVRKYRMIGTGRFFDNTDVPRDNPRLAYLEQLSRFSPRAVAVGAVTDGLSPWAFLVMLLGLPSVFRRPSSAGRLFLFAGSAVMGAAAASAFLCLTDIADLRATVLILNRQGTICSWSALVGVVVGVTTAFAVQRRRYETEAEEDVEPSSFERFRLAARRVRQWPRRHPLGAAVGAGLSVGAALALMGFACTQQVYLPTLLRVLETPGPTRKITDYLALHALCLVVPLVGVLSVASLARRVAGIHALLQKRSTTLGWLKAVVFIVLAAQLMAAGAR